MFQYFHHFSLINHIHMADNSQVLPKRTNVPGMKQFRARRFNPYTPFRSRRPFSPPFFYNPYGYGYVNFLFLILIF